MTESKPPHTQPRGPGPLGWPDDLELLRLAASPDPDPKRLAALMAAATAVEDWGRALRLARHHRLLPLLFTHLRGGEGAVPPDVLSALRDRARNEAIDVLHLSSEMARIARRFDAESIPYLVLKGPSVSEAYGGVTRRPFADNDLLVHRSDFDRVERALLDLGFNERKRSARQQAGYLLVHGEYTFGRQAGEFVSTVDLHTRLVPFALSYGPDLDVLLARSRQAEVAGERLPVLSWEDLFLTLSVNALKDQWDRLRLASDLTAVGERVTDWAAVEERARRQGVARAVRLAVLVASAVTQGLPEGVVERARQDRRAAALAGHVLAFMATSDVNPVRAAPDRARLVLLAQDGLRGQVRYVAHAALRRATERAFSPHERA